jgi:hypothetical protein
MAKIAFITRDMSDEDPDIAVAMETFTNVRVLDLSVLDISAPPVLREVIPGTLIMSPVEIPLDEMIPLGFYCAAIPGWLRDQFKVNWDCVVTRYDYGEKTKWTIHFKEVGEESEQ